MRQVCRAGFREDWRGARKVLAVRLDSLGDVLMTTPALHAIKASSPGTQLSLLTSPSGAEAARLAPDVDEILVYSAPWIKATDKRAQAEPDRAMIARLRAAEFDAAVIFTVYSQNPLPAALLCYLADIPRRLGHCRENPYQLLTLWLKEPEPETRVRHEVRRQLDLVAAAGWHSSDERLRLVPADEATERAAELLAAAGIDAERPWLVVHPGASAPSRRYPAASFAAVIRMLAAEHGWQIVLTGTRSEASLVQAIRRQAGVRCASLAGRLNVGELAALLARAPLLLSNNTGPVHVAAAVGTPVVDLYALTNPQHTPWSVPHRVLFEDVPCRYCYKSVCPAGHHECLLGVSPERVAAAVLELASERAAPNDAGERPAAQGRQKPLQAADDAALAAAGPGL
ncbi:MAG TPA: lipopolysaccharide heptosyltransferase II [Gammaproteobacteria bacterium]|nr:lipopolysaccharide heptosyltransferase II [Gammaproteobacteria bacterium]